VVPVDDPRVVLELVPPVDDVAEVAIVIVLDPEVIVLAVVVVELFATPHANDTA